MQLSFATKGRKDRPLGASPNRIDFNRLLPYILPLSAALCIFLPQFLVAFLAVALMGLMLLSDRLYLAYPVMLFFYSQLGLFLGISVHRIFTLLFLFSILLRRRRRDRKLGEQIYILPLGVYFVYLALTLSLHSGRMALFYAFDVTVVLLIILCFLRDEAKLKEFFKVFAVTAVAAFFTGLILGVEMDAYLQNSGGAALSRLMATFNDPNYMGFFYSTAIFALLTLKLFKKWIRYTLIIAFYVMLLSSLSMTAILGNVIFWTVYLLAFKKLNGKVGAVVVLVCLLLFGLYNVGLLFPDIPVLGSVSLRVEDKLYDLLSKDLNGFTTYRFELSGKAWEYFLSQNSVIRFLFGGNLANALVVNMPYGNFVAHNEYIDLLVNVGFVGTVVLVLFVVWRCLFFLSRWRTKGDDYYAYGFISKVIWIYYAATLTLFGEARFLMFYFF